jgi:hypothetical protein
MYTELPHWNQDTTGKQTHGILQSHSPLYTSSLEGTCFFEQMVIKMRNYLKSTRQIVSLHLVANYVKQEWKIPFSEVCFFTVYKSWNYISHWPNRYNVLLQIYSCCREHCSHKRFLNYTYEIMHSLKENSFRWKP